MPTDYYSLWLQIPPGKRPPDYYTLLALPWFCADVPSIEAAVHQRLDILDRHSLHPDPEQRQACQHLMNEVAQARLVLVSPERRARYDRWLGRRIPASPQRPAVPAARVARTRPPAGHRPELPLWVIAISIAAMLAATIVIGYLLLRATRPEESRSGFGNVRTVSHSPAAAGLAVSLRRPNEI